MPESAVPHPPLPEPAAHPLPEPAAHPLPEPAAHPLPEPAAHPLPAAAPLPPAAATPVAPAYEPHDPEPGDGFGSRHGYPPISDVPRADPGRHSEPVGEQRSDQPDRQPGQVTVPSGRHHGEEPAERSPWAPPSLPPGYERIPTARTAPPPEYEEAPAYREPSAASAGRVYVPSADHPPSVDPPSVDPPSVDPPSVDPPWGEPAGRAVSPPHPADPPWGEPRWSEPPRRDESDASSGLREPAADEPFYPALLPQRVPAEPDVPGVPGIGQEPNGNPTAAPELARIATYLRDEEEDGDGGSERPDGFDIPAVLAAVRLVPGVRDAHVRTTTGGGQTLRLELSEDADPGEVSRAVARLLNERMGLDAEPNDELLRPVSPAPAVPGRPTDTAAVPGRRRAAEDDAAEDDEDDDDEEAGVAESPSAVTESPSVQEPPADLPRDREAQVEPDIERAAVVRAAEDRTGVTYADRAGTVGRGVVTETRALGGRRARNQPPGTGVSRAQQRGAEQRRDSVPAHHPLPIGAGAVRVVLDQVEVGTQGTDAVVEVRLSADGGPAVGVASGPAFDGYVLRLAAVAAANAIDDLLTGSDGVPRARCFIENATVVPMGSCEVAVVVLLLAHGGWVEELSGSAVVNGDQRQAVVRATLAAVNRRLEALLS
ncbi:MAG TPA: hypothetical protein VGP31_08020 [Planosporangium sp.]|nr:hypothetical protein [Planosporangium sp.]